MFLSVTSLLLQVELWPLMTLDYSQAYLMSCLQESHIMESKSRRNIVWCNDSRSENETSHTSHLFSLVAEYGAEGFSAQGFSHGGSIRGGPPSDSYESNNQSLDPGSAPGIGFTPSPGSGAAGPPNTNFNNIHIPPGAHAPANTPAELPPPTGENTGVLFVMGLSFYHQQKQSVHARSGPTKVIARS